MTGLTALMRMGVAGFALLMAPHSHAAYTTSEAGYHGSQINANFRAISSTAAAFVGDDDYTWFALPFAFEFYGHAYAADSRGWISSNGLLGFDMANAGDYCCNGTLSFASPTNTVVAGWLDMFGTVYTQTDGTPGNRELVITWDANEYDESSAANAGGRNRFQVILREGSNDIEFQYDQLNSLVHYTSVGGIKGEAQTEGLNFVDFTQNVNLDNVGLLISSEQVPEPGSGALLGLGLAGLALVRAKRAAPGGRGRSGREG
jgi:hypothetical protein